MNRLLFGLLFVASLSSQAMDTEKNIYETRTGEASFEETENAYETLYGAQASNIWRRHYCRPDEANQELNQMLAVLDPQIPDRNKKIKAINLLLNIYVCESETVPKDEDD